MNEVLWHIKYFSLKTRLIMKFVLKPSLEHIALIQILVSLWNQNDVRILIVKLGFPEYMVPTEEKWKEIEVSVIGKVLQLSLPELLKEKLLCFIRPIGVQILEWIKLHSRDLDIHLLPAEFCWTPQGTIDRKKTAEVLIKDENLDTSTCYVLACIYCLEDDIHKFWKNMPEIFKESVSKKSYIIDFWSRNMRGRELDCISYKVEFQMVAMSYGNLGAEYFLQKLTPMEREYCMVGAAQCETDSNFLWFLLSHMNEEQQTEVFKKNPFGVLNGFLQWPLQSFFMEIANCTWDFLSHTYYLCLLRNIIDKVRKGYKDWNYQKLFREFWQKSPNTLKNLIINEIDEILLSSYPLFSLFQIKDKENIKLILHDATPTVRKKLIYSDKMNNFCGHSIRADDWDFLEFCIRECFPSKNDMLEFKEKFESSPYLTSAYFKEHFARNKQKWDQIFICPDDSLSKYDKRRVEEGECSSSKRFRNLQ